MSVSICSRTILLASAACAAALLMACPANAQSPYELKPLEHEDYDLWRTPTGRGISGNGQWVMYAYQDGKENSTLRFREASTDREYSIDQGSGGRFTWDSRFAIYRVNPAPELVKKLRQQKKPASEMPKPRVEMLELATGQLTVLEDIQTFQLPEKNGRWVAVLLAEKQDSEIKQQAAETAEILEVEGTGLQRPRPPMVPGSSSNKGAPAKTGKSSEGPTKEKPAEATTEAKSKSGAKPKTKQAGNTLVLVDLESGLQRRYPHVTSYQFSEGGETLAFASSVAAGPDQESDPNADGVWVVELQTGGLTQVLSGRGNYRNLSVSDNGRLVAFLTDRDDYEADPASWAMYLWRHKTKEANRVAMAGDRGIPTDWVVASTGPTQFSEDGQRLYFSTRPKPEPEAEDEKEPQAKLDLWHWQDPQLQPQQLLQVERERNRSYRAVYHVNRRKIVQLATTEIPDVNIDQRFPANVVVANTDEKYLKMMSWDIPGYRDVYAIDQTTGEHRLLVEKTRSPGIQSPGGKYVLVWDTDRRAWLSLAVAAADGAEPIEISKGIEFPLYDELHDTPSEPGPYGIAGWLDDDRAVLIYDRYDLWQLDPTGETPPTCLTAGRGRENRQRQRLLQLDPDARTVSLDAPLYLTLFDEQTKGGGLLRVTVGAEETLFEPLILLDEDLGGWSKARESDHLIFTRETFRMCPDVWYSSLAMEQVRRISQMNPQQRDYRWGTAELTTWQSATGEELEGLLYKPDGFDPSQQYPLLVYFYERNSDNLHRYYAPAAGRSIINFSFYVSRGYVLFVPDIPYRVGFPGQSAADAVLPGVKHIVDQGFIDPARIGMQGHSWGGYQTAYLVTQTDLFACAESGAPVSNMTSAYGGIRWGSGMSRMFQYEKTQSRIGATLWEDREKYLLNSPLFLADKINTPLLILHNDEDGAVPWYQGIELFVALRRLERPCWLLNYNGDPHWVMGEENRRDFARRMQQFFDHYLQGAPLPRWMASGLPAVEKGREFGFEAVEEAAEAETGSETAAEASGDR